MGNAFILYFGIFFQKNEAKKVVGKLPPKKVRQKRPSGRFHQKKYDQNGRREGSTKKSKTKTAVADIPPMVVSVF